jgi:uncharacterized protein YoaH (UPF0181 family)
MCHSNQQQQSVDDVQSLMNIGLATAKRLHSIGIKSAEQIMKSDAETIYEKHSQKRPSGRNDRPC